MGLESHVDRILFDDPNVFYEDYNWSDGLNISGSSTILRAIRAAKIIKVLNNSKEFGWASFDKETHKIKFEPIMS